MIRILHTVVPFAEGTGLVSRFLKQVSDRYLVEIKPLATSGSGVNTATLMKTTRQKFRACRRTNRTHVKAIKGSPISSKRVDIRRFQIRVSIDTQISPSLIIRQDHQDVWWSRDGDADECQDGKCEHYGFHARMLALTDEADNSRNPSDMKR
jgi:hypothetical protein